MTKIGFFWFILHHDEWNGTATPCQRWEQSPHAANIFRGLNEK
jgi:hypothetical protein